MAERGGLFGGLRAGRPDAAFRALFEAAAEGLALLDAEGRVVLANPALHRLAGPVVPLKPGMPAVQLLAPADRPALEEALRRGGAGRLEAAPADPSAPAGTAWTLTLRPVPGQPGLLLQVTDITPMRQAEARLRQAERLETVGRLAGGIAHDFNNLLTAVLGATAAARHAATPDEAAAELAQVEDAARRGAGLVRQLLAFARQQTLQPKVLSLNGVVRGIAPLLGRLLGHKVRLELALEEPGRLVKADAAELDRVLLNLAANAREAMPAGGVLRLATGHAVLLRPEVTGSQTIPPGRYAVLEVADTGAGMPAELQARIFEPFFTSRPEKGGTGLGLATVLGIVGQHGGHITVRSAPGQGTCFRILLPRHEGELPEAPPPAASPALAAPAAAGTVLVVEDEAPLRRLAELVLKRAGHAVLAADSAEAALELLGEGPPPALVVTDVAMPGMDGLALARQLRGRWPALPVVLVSGYAAATIGCDFESERLGFLAKPYGPAELLGVVSARLAGGGGQGTVLA